MWRESTGFHFSAPHLSAYDAVVYVCSDKQCSSGGTTGRNAAGLDEPSDVQDAVSGIYTTERSQADAIYLRVAEYCLSAGLLAVPKEQRSSALLSSLVLHNVYVHQITNWNDFISCTVLTPQSYSCSLSQQLSLSKLCRIYQRKPNHPQTTSVHVAALMKSTVMHSCSRQR